MTKENSITLVYTTISDIQAAESLSKIILEAGLAACANITTGGVSMYYWREKLERSQEVYILFKTINEKAAMLVSFIAKHHPYSLPAILSFEADSSQDFYQYLLASQKKLF